MDIIVAHTRVAASELIDGHRVEYAEGRIAGKLFITAYIDELYQSMASKERSNVFKFIDDFYIQNSTGFKLTFKNSYPVLLTFCKLLFKLMKIINQSTSSINVT